SITNNQISNIDTNVGWLAELSADRAVFSKTNPAALAGNYTMIIPADAAAPGPDGDGFAKVTISPAGVISLAGTLADGTKAVQKVAVSKNGAWPLYVPLYKNLGAVVSWQAFDTNQASTDFSGLLSWVKQSMPTAKYYPGGFTNQSTALGSRYVAPLVGRVLALTNALAGFTNGNLTANFANNVTLGVDNKILNNSANALSLTIQKPSGLFTGSVTPPVGGAAQPFKGALLQKQNRGAGFFLGTSKSGE